MRKIFAAVLLAAMLPAISFALTNEEVRAQINALLAEIAQLQQLLDRLSAGGAAVSTLTSSTTSGSVICSLSRYPIARGATGREVALVQEFLKSLGFFSGTATSFFGPLTERALTDFQLQHGIISSRSEGGVFGRRTFNYVLGRFCTSPISGVSSGALPVGNAPTLQQCNASPATPGVACTGTWVKTYSSECHVGWTCVASSTPSTAVAPSNKSPLISAIIGPTLRKPDEGGTWKVDATDAEGEALLYSMVWGDEGSSALQQILNIAREGTKYSSQSSYTHAYKNSGTYTIIAFVKDTAGNDTTASLDVLVPTPPPPPPPPPAAGGAGQGSGGSDSGKIYACYLDGKGYDVDITPSSCGTYGGAGAGDARPTPPECAKYYDASPVCTARGWSGNLWGGGYISLQYPVSVGCTAMNELKSAYTTNPKFYIPGNMKVLGGWCTAEEGTNRTDCDGYFVCKRDGWWMLDGTGFEIRKLDHAPGIIPEQFYPQF